MIHNSSSEKVQLQAILAHMTEAVVAVNRSGRVMVANPALCRLFNLSPHSVEGRPFLEVLRHNRLKELLDTVLQKGGPALTQEVQIFAPEERSFEVHAVALTEEGSVAGAVLVLHDITRLRKLEEARKEFVANVTHELKTPLASIKAFAETLRTGGLDDGNRRLEFVEAIEKDADRMNALVDDLLTLSRIESGRGAALVEKVALAPLAREAALSLSALAQRRGIRMDIEGPETAVIKGEPSQWRRIFLNLIENAIKFNKDQGRVHVRISSAGGQVIIEVEDTGVGIPAEDLPRIFERFYRVDKARSRNLGGTGLGLAIVKHIVETHHGTIQAQSQEGRGSLFLLRLPSSL